MRSRLLRRINLRPVNGVCCTEKKTHRGRVAVESNQRCLHTGEIYPPRASVHAAPMVGTATVGGCTCSDLRADGGRPLGPDIFKTEKAQDKERQRLFRIIEELVKWENTTNETVLQQARR